jgi:hypothetical protein
VDSVCEKRTDGAALDSLPASPAAAPQPAGAARLEARAADQRAADTDRFNPPIGKPARFAGLGGVLPFGPFVEGDGGASGLVPP